MKVFLDFGHGGTDSGAIGQNLQEKDVVLNIGTKVKKHLERYNIQVNTSRDTDKTVSLEQRCRLANSIESNCFISLHCNSFSNSSAKGLEVYSSSYNTKDLATILYNQLLKDNLYNVKRGVKHSNFYILKNTKMRAALIELAFISNIDDAKLLREKQDEFAESIARGICVYLKVNYV
ncbi:N-acetylmuramoyl-L-alanine amidase family protein [Romboutsia sp.]|uniref:N-acetylmuramoyl-L-alanine amidase family protein n=1 Tax=Romboutsia sp. TaxID=1965302 RepID=UPI003F2C4F8E